MIGPRLVDKPLVLYGYGKLGHLAEEIFHELNIPISLIINREVHISIPHKDDYLLAVCVATESYNKIVPLLDAAGWADIVPVWDIIEAYPEVRIHNGWFMGKTSDEDNEGILDLGEAFDYDRCSLWHYLQFRKWHDIREDWISENHPIEPMISLPSTLADIRQRQYVGIYEDVWVNGKPCLCEVDIHSEGKELETIQINIKTFQNQRPKISCACYHSRDGLYLIEKTLMDNLPDYRWTFRLTAYMGQGAYIYGMPKERE